jgi:hypothetical protein
MHASLVVSSYHYGQSHVDRVLSLADSKRLLILRLVDEWRDRVGQSTLILFVSKKKTHVAQSVSLFVSTLTAGLPHGFPYIYN